MSVFSSRLAKPTGTSLDKYIDPELRVAQGRLSPYYSASDINLNQPRHYVKFDRADGAWRFLDNLKGPYQQGCLWDINIDFPTTVSEAYIIFNDKAYHFTMPQHLRVPRSNLISTGFLFQNYLPVVFGDRDHVKLVVKLGRDEHGAPRHMPDQGLVVTYRVES
jgi:hypothetical protein